VPKTTQTFERWAILSFTRSSFLCVAYDLPLTFTTRAQARRLIGEQFGWLRERSDLRRPPHNWRMPRAVKVRVTMEEM
jgi:hypothetical protein